MEPGAFVLVHSTFLLQKYSFILC